MNHPPNVIEVKPPKPEQRFIVISQDDDEKHIFIRPCLSRTPIIKLPLKHPLGTIMYGLNKIIDLKADLKETELIWRAYVDNNPLGMAYDAELFGIPCETHDIELQAGAVFESELYGSIGILPNIAPATLSTLQTRGYCYITPCEFMHKSVQSLFGSEVLWYIVDELQFSVFGQITVQPQQLSGYSADAYRYQFVDKTKPEDSQQFGDTEPWIYGLCTHNDERITTYLGSTLCARRTQNKIGKWYRFHTNPPTAICVQIRETKPVLPTRVLKNNYVAVRATVPAPAWSRFSGYLSLVCRHQLLFRIVFPNQCAFYQDNIDVVMIYADHTVLGQAFYVVAVHNGIDMAWLDNRDNFYRHLCLQSDFPEIRSRLDIQRKLIVSNNYVENFDVFDIDDLHVTIPTLNENGEYEVKKPKLRTFFVEPWPKKQVVEPDDVYRGDPWIDFEKTGIIAGVSGPIPTFQQPVIKVSEFMEKKARENQKKEVPTPKKFVPSANPRPTSSYPRDKQNFVANPHCIAPSQTYRGQRFTQPYSAPVSINNAIPPPPKFRANPNNNNASNSLNPSLLTPIPEETSSIFSYRTESVFSYKTDRS